MDLSDLTNVFGTILAVDINARISPYCACGTYGGMKVLVTHGQEQIGKRCIVRLDSSPYAQRKGLIGNFISSHVPPGLCEMRHSEYILLGLWEESMNKDERYPSLSEINQYFDPGDLHKVLFVEKNSNHRNGKTLLTSTQQDIDNHYSWNRIINELTFKRRSRVVLVEGSLLKLESIARSISDKGIIPILMEPIK